MKKKQTVLIVDDISDNLNVAANILIKENLNVLLAQSGKEAIIIAEKLVPDLILLDIMMPQMDGFEVCKTIKSNKKTENISIIFLTAKTEKESIIKGFQLGAVDFISKPFFELELIARVKTHLDILSMRNEIEDANAILEQKVKERTKQLNKINSELKLNNLQLEKAKIKAEESDRLKTSFLNSISHEIRTPMNGIIGFANLLNEPNLSAEERESYTATIVESSNQLMSIVSDIMTISTIHAGQEIVKKQNQEINSLINSVISTFKIEAKKNNVNLYKALELENQFLEIYTDASKLRQILTKLISNAVKYTKNGNVICGYSIENEFIKFFVEDTGIGISQDMHSEIFEQFRQVELELARNYGGTGLGLSIAKAYVNLLGGEIWLESELGKGSIFYFTIPFEKK